MRLSHECEYAVDALVWLAARPSGVVPAADVAEGADLPPAFLSKILHKLTRHGLVTSRRGRRRGYALARPSDEITLQEVVAAIEGPDVFDRCLFGDPIDANDPHCQLHPLWVDLQAELSARMARVTLAHLADGPASVRRALGKA